jgi:hypothetical protein
VLRSICWVSMTVSASRSFQRDDAETSRRNENGFLMPAKLRFLSPSRCRPGPFLTSGADDCGQ